MRKLNKQSVLLFLLLFFIISCSNNKEKIIEKCNYNTGVVHLYHLVNEKFYDKKLPTDSSADTIYRSIDDILGKIMMIIPDTTGEDSYLANGRNISETSYKIFLETRIYDKMRRIKNINSFTKKNTDNDINNLIDYCFLSSKPYFSEDYLKRNTVDNICADLIILQLHFLSFIECNK